MDANWKCWEDRCRVVCHRLASGCRLPFRLPPNISAQDLWAPSSVGTATPTGSTTRPAVSAQDAEAALTVFEGLPEASSGCYPRVVWAPGLSDSLRRRLVPPPTLGLRSAGSSWQTGLRSTVSVEEISLVYRRMCLRGHPSRGGVKSLSGCGADQGVCKGEAGLDVANTASLPGCILQSPAAGSPKDYLKLQAVARFSAKNAVSMPDWYQVAMEVIKAFCGDAGPLQVPCAPVHGTFFWCG